MDKYSQKSKAESRKSKVESRKSKVKSRKSKDESRKKFNVINSHPLLWRGAGGEEKQAIVFLSPKVESQKMKAEKNLM
ncbi:MAG: hypothetical protein CFE24_06990 [Flavobacterium sp. BFFFF2]|nr:MAG: hypothetical protein CFE24_06990 [Flavobacterium sp. BFFFF2]